MTIQAGLQFATAELNRSGKTTSPRLDAEIILGFVLGKTRTDLILLPKVELSARETEEFLQFVERRKRGEPVAYILGKREFYKETFFVGPGVLIPRPETEHIVEDVVEYSKSTAVARILELGVGSGCLGLSCLLEVPKAVLVGVEKSPRALEIAERNAEALGLTERVEWKLGGVESLVPAMNSDFDVIVANPPYIGPGEELGAGVAEFEPHEALFSDNGGYGHHFRWAKVAIPKLRPGGLLVFEMGADQGPRIQEFFEKTGAFEDLRIKKDLAGLDRRIWGIRRSVERAK